MGLAALALAALASAAAAARPAGRIALDSLLSARPEPAVYRKHRALAAVQPVASNRAICDGLNVTGWTTEHHDLRNSGESQFTGPVSDGYCRVSFFKDDPIDPQVARFLSTGVTNSQGGTTGETATFHFGGTDNIARFVQQTAAIFTEYSCPLTTAFGLPALTSYGIVASAVSWTVKSGAGAPYDRMAVPSADGHVYALNWAACVANASICQKAGSVQEEEEQGARVALRETVPAGADGSPSVVTEAGVAGVAPKCLQWAASFARPIMSPPRYLDVATVKIGNASAGGIVIVAETDPLINTGGMLRALRADDGQQAWSHNASYGGQSYGLMGLIPAVDTSRNAAFGGVVYLGYGPRLVALNATSGGVLASIDDKTVADLDDFVSSPTLTSDGSALFIHSSTGTLYRINIGGSGTAASPLTLTIAWACDYTLEAYWSGANPCKAGPKLAERSATIPWPVRDPFTGRVLRTAMLPRASFRSAGGWYQAATTAQVAALHAALADAYAAHVAAGTAKTTLSAEALSAMPAALRAAAHASALPEASLNALLVEADEAGAYVRLAGNGRAAAVTRQHQLSAAPPATTFPYSTPALYNGDSSVVVSQFVALGKDTALFRARASDGGPFFAFANFTAFFGGVVPFGRSRSSPAVDAADAIFVGADIDDLIFGANDTLPVMFALNPTGKVRWATDMGLEHGVVVGAASPIIKTGAYSDTEVYLAAADGSVGISNGAPCPTDDVLVDCSGHGSCDCITGVCACESDPCYQGKDAVSGAFNCAPVCGYVAKCRANRTAFTATCYCDDGCAYNAATQSCDCPPASGNSGKDWTNGEIAAVAVVGTVSFVGVAALFAWKVFNPKSSLLPNALRRALGLKQYEKVSSLAEQEYVYGSTASSNYGTRV